MTRVGKGKGALHVVVVVVAAGTCSKIASLAKTSARRLCLAPRK